MAEKIFLSKYIFSKYIKIDFSLRTNKIFLFRKNFIKENEEISYDFFFLYFRFYYVSQTNLPF